MAQGTVAERAGKYLTFTLGREIYGLEILKVQEIIGMIPTTGVPGTPGFIRGVINLRGKVIPVVELRLKFGMESVPDTEKTCIIVVQVSLRGGQVTMGIIVDEVFEVVAMRFQFLVHALALADVPQATDKHRSLFQIHIGYRELGGECRAVLAQHRDFSDSIDYA